MNIVEQVTQLIKANEQFPSIVHVEVQDHRIHEVIDEWIAEERARGKAGVENDKVPSCWDSPISDWQKAARAWAAENPRCLLKVSIEVPSLDGWQEVWHIGKHARCVRDIAFAQANLTGRTYGLSSDNQTLIFWVYKH